MQDLTDCRDSHREMLSAGHEYPANCELDRMDRMAVRVEKYWQRMKQMWQSSDNDECPQEHLDEIAINVTNLGEMVKGLVEKATQYSEFYRMTNKTKELTEQSRGDNDRGRKR